LLPAEARFLRTCLGLSKADLARDLGEPAEAVAAWESKAHLSVMRLETEMRLRLMAVYLAPVQHYGPERLGAVARQEPRQTEIRIVPSKRGWQPAPATA
jgi:transcriptional regulator with XRE-family HTH domain